MLFVEPAEPVCIFSICTCAYAALWQCSEDGPLAQGTPTSHPPWPFSKCLLFQLAQVPPAAAPGRGCDCLLPPLLPPRASYQGSQSSLQSSASLPP